MMTAGIYKAVVTETGTAVEPVAVDDAKVWMRVDYADDDTLIESMITAAREDIENELEIKLVDASVVAYVNVKDSEDEYLQFPGALKDTISNLVVNLLTKGSDDEEQVLDTDYYFDNGLSFSGTGKYKIEYDVDASAIPETLKEAIKMLVAYRYNNRGDQEKQQGIPEDVMNKIYKYKQIWL